ncbi:DHH family phosphoesterase, partial [Candidatus Saccharibacteria bacterium]|nr:DHH family phosphoesterase [Candidatus Saccharibacteria bacterium]
MKEIEERIKWIRPKKATIPVARLARSILRSRGIDTKSDSTWLEPDYRSLGDPFDLPDMKQAVEHLVATRKDNKKVAVYGDYDIDGLTATTLLAEALRACGFQVISYIPDRFVEGYGLHSQALLDLRSQGVDTVITVDCGITAVEAIADAVAAGLNIIVTDHHSLAESEPVGAVALINPLRANNTYPQTNLAGVGVAFNLVRALQTEFSDELPPGQEKWLLDLVALGTICDIVPLVGENRILAHFGLKVARQSRRPGFQALADVSNAELGRINAKDFGFRFGPRLNAAGRLEHAQAGLDVLSSENYSQAFASAQKLQNLNLARRELTESICEQARQQARAMSEVNFLVLADATWSHGVAGLVASRIAEEFSKPTI